MNKGFCQIPIDRLVKAGWNYKQDNQGLMDKLVENIRRNGQIENIIIRDMADGSFEIINGNHRLDAMRALEFESVYCYNLGDISDAQAKRIAIETNETKFFTDQSRLEEIILEIIEEDGLDDFSLSMPFSDDYVNSIINHDINLDEFFEDITNTEKEEETKELICPHCGKNVYVRSK